MPSIAGRRAAVVGGTGFIGSHLVERLVAEGAEVLVIARTPSRLPRLASVNNACAVALADVCDAHAVRRVFRRWRPEVVFHLAAHPDANESLEHIADCMRVNGLGVVNVLQAAASCGVNVLVYGDSAKDYGNAVVPYRAAQIARPICSYAIVKAAGWQLCELVASFTGLQVVALRPTFVYGPRQNTNVITYVGDCIASGRPVRLMGGSQTRDPLYVEDAVSAFVLAALHPRAWGHAIPIGGGQELTVTSLCEAVIAALGATGQVMPGAEKPRPTEIWRSSSDNVDAFHLLEWEPRVTLRDGLARTVADWIGTHTATPSAAVVARSGYYIGSGPNGLRFRMLDRREPGDRRSTFHGGRRIDDVRPLVADPAPVVAMPTIEAPVFTMARSGREEVL